MSLPWIKKLRRCLPVRQIKKRIMEINTLHQLFVLPTLFVNARKHFGNCCQACNVTA